MGSLSARLVAGDIVILDGGVGSEIQRRTGTLDPCAWSGFSHLDHPEVVLGIHRDYIHAGAQVITANTFSSAKHILECVGLGDDFERINRCGDPQRFAIGHQVVPMVEGQHPRPLRGIAHVEAVMPLHGARKPPLIRARKLAILLALAGTKPRMQAPQHMGEFMPGVGAVAPVRGTNSDDVRARGRRHIGHGANEKVGRVMDHPIIPSCSVFAILELSRPDRHEMRAGDVELLLPGSTGVRQR
jgi:hypothetical protein